jgi:hypothetical protein
VAGLPLGAQHPVKARFAREIHPLIGEHGDDARRRHLGKASLVSRLQDLRALGGGECMGGRVAYRIRAPVSAHQAFLGFPALQRAHTDAGELPGQSQPRTSGLGLLDVPSHRLAIFQTDHSSAPSPKIADSVLELRFLHCSPKYSPNAKQPRSSAPLLLTYTPLPWNSPYWNSPS